MNGEQDLQAVFLAVSDKWFPGDDGRYFGGLAPHEIAIVLMTMFDTEVCNGGFLHWTTCQIGEYAAETRDAVVSVGDLKVATLIDTAVARLAADRPSMNDLVNNQSMYDLDSEYYSVRLEFVDKCLQWWNATQLLH